MKIIPIRDPRLLIYKHFFVYTGSNYDIEKIWLAESIEDVVDFYIKHTAIIPDHSPDKTIWKFTLKDVPFTVCLWDGGMKATEWKEMETTVND